jgi:hypothetical protein
MNCKQCGYPIDTGCTHLDCQGAHAQGFCGKGCQEAYYALKEYELKQAL